MIALKGTALTLFAMPIFCPSKSVFDNSWTPAAKENVCFSKTQRKSEVHFF